MLLSGQRVRTTFADVLRLHHVGVRGMDVVEAVWAAMAILVNINRNGMPVSPIHV
jgi:hypothetical protein